MNNFLIGQVVAFAGNFAPKGWMLCNGQILSIAQNTALFSILGTTYGGDGRTNFALPDLRGCGAISAGAAPGLPPYNLGDTGGSENTTMTVAQMPVHTHPATATVTINANDSRADKESPEGTVLSQNTDTPIYMADPDGSTTMNAGAITPTVTVAPAGGSQPFSVLMPYLTINYCICVEGIFPSRN